MSDGTGLTHVSGRCLRSLQPRLLSERRHLVASFDKRDQQQRQNFKQEPMRRRNAKPETAGETTRLSPGAAPRAKRPSRRSWCLSQNRASWAVNQRVPKGPSPLTSCHLWHLRSNVTRSLSFLKKPDCWIFV